MSRNPKWLSLCLGLIAGLLCFIWGNSLLTAEASRAFSDWVLRLLGGNLPGITGDINAGSGLLRKLAHFSEFAALGMALGWLAGMLKKSEFWPLYLGLAAACMDETIQCFVPGRGPGLMDVGIDVCGVAAGICLLKGAKYLHKKLWRKIL